MQKQHSFLHDIRIATPCKADWSKMTGDERVRFCGACKLNVYNISEMNTDEAEKLIIEKEGKLCVRMYRRKDGTLINKDCPVGLLKRRCTAAFGTITAALSLFTVWFLNTVRSESGIVQGQMVVPKPDVCRRHDERAMTGAMAWPPPVQANGGVSIPQEVYLGGRHGSAQK